MNELKSYPSLICEKSKPLRPQVEFCPASYFLLLCHCQPVLCPFLHWLLKIPQLTLSKTGWLVSFRSFCSCQLLWGCRILFLQPFDPLAPCSLISTWPISQITPLGSIIPPLLSISMVSPWLFVSSSTIGAPTPLALSINCHPGGVYHISTMASPPSTPT